MAGSCRSCCASYLLPECWFVAPPAQALPTIVIDTNVVLDLWLFEDRHAHWLRSAVEGGILDVVRSIDCDRELADVLERRQFAGFDNRAGLVARWQLLARPISQVRPAPWHCSDRGDQKFLDLAHSSAARALITKDRALLKLAPAARRDRLEIVALAETASLLGIQDRLA